MPYAWNPAHAARIGILPKYGAAEQIVWLSVKPCFVFHAANAYRDHDNIVVDLIVHDHMFQHSSIGPFEQQQTRFERWYIDLKSKQVHVKILDEQVQEFPRIDERYIGVKHRYVYCVSYDSALMDKANQLLIHDVLMQQKNVYDYGDEWLSGEVIFVPQAQDAAEGCGYLISYVHHVQAQSSKVVILKANGLQLSLAAEILLDVRVPLGFHANWVDLS